MVPEGKSREQWVNEITSTDSLFQYYAGNFMKIFYFICFTVLIKLSLIIGCYLISKNCCKPKQESEYNYD